MDEVLTEIKVLKAECEMLLRIAEAVVEQEVGEGGFEPVVEDLDQNWGSSFAIEGLAYLG
jgi:hypothetical protein